MFQRPNRQMQPAFSNPRAVLDGDGLPHAFIFDQAGQPFTGTIGIAGDDHGAVLKFLFKMRCQGPEKANSFLLSFRCKVTS